MYRCNRLFAENVGHLGSLTTGPTTSRLRTGDLDKRWPLIEKQVGRKWSIENQLASKQFAPKQLNTTTGKHVSMMKSIISEGGSSYVGPSGSDTVTEAWHSAPSTSLFLLEASRVAPGGPRPAALACHDLPPPLCCCCCLSLLQDASKDHASDHTSKGYQREKTKKMRTPTPRTTHKG